MDVLHKVLYPWDTPVEEPNHRYLLDYRYEELATLIRSWGYREANAKKLFAGLHRHGFQSIEQFENLALARTLMERLRDPAAPPLRVFSEVRDFPSEDGSVKYLFTTREGLQVEGVYMPFENRVTLCLSSQVGCALGCTFCATGALGFRKNLTPGEIVAQVVHMRRRHPDPLGKTQRLNLVFMGMGEPLHNMNNVLAAYEIMTHSAGMVLSERDIAVSTSGLVPRIEALGRLDKRPQLMVSIAATTDEARSAIMPVNRAYPLETLLRALERFPLRKNEKIMLSYVLIAGVNDRPEDASRLAAMSRRFPSLINLIPMNEHKASPKMREPAEERLQSFFYELADQGAFVTIRRSRGRDVAGACGQLAANPNTAY